MRGIFKREVDGIVLESEPQDLQVLSVSFQGHAESRGVLQRTVLICPAHVPPYMSRPAQH